MPKVTKLIKLNTLSFISKIIVLPLLISINNIYAENNIPQVNNKCNIPQYIKAPKLSKIDCTNKTSTDYYMLSLSWSPQFCYKAKGENKTQCQDNKFNFVVHGLWPQKTNAKNKCEQPRNCNASLVDEKIIKQNLCILPSEKLIQDEWQKHGSCAFNNPNEYYTNIQNLWFKLNKPNLIAIQHQKKTITIADIKQEFIKINPKLTANAINLEINKARYLEEVRICYNIKMEYNACEKSGIPDYIKVKIAQ